MRKLELACDRVLVLDAALSKCVGDEEIQEISMQFLAWVCVV